MEEEQGIYRGEVRTIMFSLADLNVKVDQLLAYFGEGDDEQEEEED